MDDTAESRLDSEQPTPGDHDDEKTSRTALALVNTVNKVVRNGVGPVTGSAAWAESRLRAVQGDRYDSSLLGNRGGTPAEDVDKVIGRLIKESVMAAGSAGFVTGLGGFLTLPITLPANVAGALVINVRLAGAIAYLRGYDLDDPHTQAMIPLVAVGSNIQSTLSTLGAQIGVKLTEQAIRKVSIDLIRKINQKLGFMLLAKYGTKRALITLAKAVPLVGGVVGGGIDATLTGAVGRSANKLFTPLTP
ncbi:EcsC family protein [Micromonospora sp. WMMA1949]|uniref:EcsC family protein n=1 Tax=unclassified Micromonospora TaxID=2617518 RepID=UPI0022B67B30|nr:MULTISPECIES: EcsC family protein [unclassified Micromonospora]MCZ7426735.1 EcsC family protein [Micromonospora sp. WMMA1949]WBC11254.1 EcsC family protein [Micromonospora sp. WMMA1947]